MPTNKPAPATEPKKSEAPAKDIYTFHFYPCANTGLTGGGVNEPTVQFGALTDAYVGQAYTLTFTVDAVFGVQELRASLNGTDLACTEAAGVYTLEIPAASVAGESLQVVVSGTDTRDVAFTATANISVKDEPVITGLTPAAGSQTGENKRPVISAAIANAGENPRVEMRRSPDPCNRTEKRKGRCYPDSPRSSGRR